MVKIDWRVEGSYFLAGFLYFPVSSQVRMKIKLPVMKISMRTHFLGPYCPSPQPHKQSGYIPAKADVVVITFHFWFILDIEEATILRVLLDPPAQRELTPGHAVVGTESC